MQVESVAEIVDAFAIVSAVVLVLVVVVVIGDEMI